MTSGITMGRMMGMLFENMLMALSAIKANKMRSFLTMLGIIIGISSVISVVSIGDSMRALFKQLYQSIGITQAYLYVSWNVDEYRDEDFFNLDEKDRFQEVFADDLDYVACSTSASGEAVYKHNKEKYDFLAVDYNYTDVQPVDLVAGRFLNEADIKARRNNLVLEEKGAKKLFGGQDPLGKTCRVTIEGNVTDFTVVGIYRKNLSPIEALLMGSGDSQEGFMPYSLLVTPDSTFRQIHLFLKEDADDITVSLRMRQYVANLKNRTVDEITYFSAKDQLGSWDSIMGGLSAAVGGIASISLLVGGIGIMNIMLVSVTERTKEIGIRKALGARTRDVLIQFLTESAILSALGGIIGVILAVGLLSLGGAVLGVAVVVKPMVVAMAVSFSAVVGVFFGIYPASKAAKKDPIEALRFE